MPSEAVAELENLDFRYDSRTVVLHWLTALLVVFLWGSSQIIDSFPKGDPRIAMRSVHIIAGVMLALVLMYRVTWRYTKGSHPAEETGAIAAASKFVHFALYALLVLEVVLGLGNIWVRGDSIFGLFKVPTFPGSNKAIHDQMAELHMWVGHSLAILAVLHSVAALIHHFILRDRLVARMSFGRRTR